MDASSVPITVVHLPGKAALSRFRLDKLLLRLRQIAPAVNGLDARFHYMLVTAGPLDADARRRLRLLLEIPDSIEDNAAACVVVTPRRGTISPWSSKATDIAVNCGLHCIRRIERACIYRLQGIPATGVDPRLIDALHDRMTESAFGNVAAAEALFAVGEPAPLVHIALTARGRTALEEANAAMGLALSDDEVAYLHESFLALERDPTDVELMMFAQANSEHCRHKIFNASWTIDGERRNASLFQMIRNTHALHPGGVLSAYSDNSAVTRGHERTLFFAHPVERVYTSAIKMTDLLMKVETHNHPTAISPFAGAATGSGGEIRDEAATGRGAFSKAGLTGFSVSSLRIPDLRLPWEHDHGQPDRIASALDIMLEGPIGAAGFNNEFGRPALAGYFRTLEIAVGDRVFGYHKPIMIAGGMGNIIREQVEKQRFQPGAHIVVLGGPAMLIGLGGGAASSMASGHGDAELDFASVQRDNAEMQRRCQEVINRCWQLAHDNPIASIHDVGAGGLSNAVPELINDAGRGGIFHLRTVPADDRSMSPLEIWCNESQERFVLAVTDERLAVFEQICARERCPFAVLGTATEDRQLRLDDDVPPPPIDMPLNLLFGKPPAMQRDVGHTAIAASPLDIGALDLAEAIDRVLTLPAVASKRFLITIGDRTVSGLVARDQMVGPWQVPVADCAITLGDYHGVSGEAMAIGERTPLAILDAPASGRMAVGEALSNLAASGVSDLSQVVLSANWMAACGAEGEDARLFDTVHAVGMELCPALGLCIPVGKDSLSMRTVWSDRDGEREVMAPLSLIVSAFVPVDDVREHLTPELTPGVGRLLLVDLGLGRRRLGASALAQVYGASGETVPDLDDPAAFRAAFQILTELVHERRLLACHDRSDGGLLVSVLEMCFAARCGVDLELSNLGEGPIQSLFNEELGWVVQVDERDLDEIRRRFRAEPALAHHLHDIGAVRADEAVNIRSAGERLFSGARATLEQQWSLVSYHMQALRDHPACAREEHERITMDDPGLAPLLTFDPRDGCAEPAAGARPRVAVLREQGVNGQVEMAAAFDRAGFEAHDVHMSDLIEGRASLRDFVGLVAGGGFSYGDVLGGGGGWAASIRHNPRAREEFMAFVARADTFALGVCNGCQMMSRLSDIIPGASRWPRFERNRSEQFEARLSLVDILPSPSLFLSGMQGSRLPVAVAHGEGLASFSDREAIEHAERSGLVCMRFVDGHGQATERYPENPNGSPHGITGLTTADGRFTIMMPHPERVFRSVQHSWCPPQWGEQGPWLRMFQNARRWLT